MLICDFLCSKKDNSENYHILGLWWYCWKKINKCTTDFIWFYKKVLDLFGMNKTIECVKNISLLLKKELQIVQWFSKGYFL